MSKKWYNYIVTIDDPAAQPTPGKPGVPAPASKTPAPGKSAAQSVAEIAATVASEPQFTTPVFDPTSFDEIYKAAEIDRKSVV